MMRALLVLVVGLPPVLIVLFMPGYLYHMREEIAWRAHTDPFAFLSEWRGGRYHEMALAQLDDVQRPDGYLARFISSPYGVSYRRGRQTLAVVLSPDETQALAATPNVAEHWETQTGKQLHTYGEKHRRDAPDVRTLGFGLTQVAWYEKRVVAMTSGPSSIFFFGANAAPPLRVADHGVEDFAVRGQRAVFVESFERGQVLDLKSRRLTALPHPDISAIAPVDDDVVVSASRNEIQWWREGKPDRRIPIRAPYNPLAISADARWVLGLAGNHALLWDTRSGALRQIAHSTEATAVCALGEVIVTGTQDGRIHLWPAREGAPQRSFRASTVKIDALTCGRTRLISTSYDQTDVRVWDVVGRPAQGMVATPVPPRQEWIVRLGANANLPARLPALTAWLEDDPSGDRYPWAIGALLVVLVAAMGLAKRARRK